MWLRRRGEGAFVAIVGETVSEAQQRYLEACFEETRHVPGARKASAVGLLIDQPVSKRLKDAEKREASNGS
jgi:hypothetical protein